MAKATSTEQTKEPQPVVHQMLETQLAELNQRFSILVKSLQKRTLSRVIYVLQFINLGISVYLLYYVLS